MDELRKLLVEPICKQCNNNACTTKSFYSWRCLCRETIDIVNAQIKSLELAKYGKMVQPDCEYVGGFRVHPTAKFQPIKSEDK
jgi:hypothetical protein